MCGGLSEVPNDDGAFGWSNEVAMARKRKREMREALEVVNFMLTWS
jgi:hypothetical protein